MRISHVYKLDTLAMSGLVCDALNDRHSHVAIFYLDVGPYKNVLQRHNIIGRMEVKMIPGANMIHLLQQIQGYRDMICFFLKDILKSLKGYHLVGWL